MLVAQSFLVIGFVQANFIWVLQLALATLGIIVTIFTLYVGVREKDFFFMVREELTKLEKDLPLEDTIFRRIDNKLDKKKHLNVLGRGSEVLCIYLQACFGAFWLFCVVYSLRFIN